MMAGTRQDHVKFWRRLASEFKSGVVLVEAVERAAEEVQGSGLDAAAEDIARQAKQGVDFSEAMEKHTSLFPRSVRMMVRAGEAGGVLDVVMDRIAGGVETGAFPIPGAAAAEGDAQARMWRALAILLSSGVSLFETLDIVRDEVTAGGLRQAVEAIKLAIMAGESMASALREFPELFHESVVGAVQFGEKEGTLDEGLEKIADALEAGDVSSLPRPGPAREGEQKETLESDEEAPPVVKLVNLLIVEAIEEGASDIHLDRSEGGEMPVRYRQSGVLHRRQDIPKGVVNAVVSRIKIMANLDIAERRRPQDGKIGLIVRGERIDLRVSVLPTARGESVVMRILRPAKLRLDLDSFGFPEEKVATFRELAHLPGGIVIVCGPAGSGKSTLLYSMIDEIDRDALCVVSVEDPVEYHLEGVRQVQINTKGGLTYTAALRSVMRQDPDVVVIGEMQDLETAQLAVRAAVTGHLVLVCMHAPTATAAVKLLLDLGLEPYQVNTSLAAAISQRLIRKLCPECRRRIEPSIDSMPQEAVDFVHEKGATVYGPVGCDSCAGGYRGRDAIHEILVPPATMHKGFREALARAADEAEIRKAAVEAGMKTLFKDGLEKAAAGVTSVEEVCRVAWGAR